jgi:hypothetical protein
MRETSHAPTEQAVSADARSASRAGRKPAPRGIRRSIVAAVVLLFWDGAFSGSFLFSILVCPFWFLGSVLNNAVKRPGWRLGLLRIAIPPLTLGLVLDNDAIQYRIATAKAPRVAAACEEFHAANGRFPKTLDELVPQYLESVPRAKYCLVWGEFQYWNNDEHAILVWYVVPPHGRRIYNFHERRWGYLD